MLYALLSAIVSLLICVLDLYPIVPSFQDWEFPHDRIPDFWPQVSASSISCQRCGISNSSLAVEGAYIVPGEEAAWYLRNEMGIYAPGLVRDINNPANILPLKADIHKCFDKRMFAIVPKVPDTSTPPQYVTHILLGEAAEFWPACHNTLVQYLPGRAHPYLFARFAWAILLQVKTFITAGSSRWVFRISTNEKGEIEQKKEHINGPLLNAYYAGGGSARATPMKRSRSGTTPSSNGSLVESGEGSDVDMDSDWRDEWEHRGEPVSTETTIDGNDKASLLAKLRTQLEEVLCNTQL